MKRMRTKGRGTIVNPGDPLDGTRVLIIETMRDGRLLVRTDPGMHVMRIEADKVKLEPP